MSSRYHRSLILEVTHACNYNCLHCYRFPRQDNNGNIERLSTEQMLILLDDVIRDTGASLISLSGGEPLLHPDIFEIIDFLKTRNITVNLITNGSKIDDTAIERLMPDKISVYELPLLSGSAQIHDSLCASEGAFDRTSLAIAKLKAAGQIVVSVFVATKVNLPQLEDAIRLAIALGVDGIMFNRFNPGGTGFENIEKLQPSPEDLNKALIIADYLGRENELPISCSVPMPPCLIDMSKYPNIETGFCALGTEDAYFTIDPYGNLRPCNHSPTIIGNLTERSFWDLVDSESLSRYTASLPLICLNCHYAGKCKGCCRAAAESCYGSPEKTDPFVEAFLDRCRDN